MKVQLSADAGPQLWRASVCCHLHTLQHPVCGLHHLTCTELCMHPSIAWLSLQSLLNVLHGVLVCSLLGAWACWKYRCRVAVAVHSCIKLRIFHYQITTVHHAMMCHRLKAGEELHVVAGWVVCDVCCVACSFVSCIGHLWGGGFHCKGLKEPPPLNILTTFR